MESSVVAVDTTSAARYDLAVWVHSDADLSYAEWCHHTFLIYSLELLCGDVAWLDSITHVITNNKKLIIQKYIYFVSNASN